MNKHLILTLFSLTNPLVQLHASISAITYDNTEVSYQNAMVTNFSGYATITGVNYTKVGAPGHFTIPTSYWLPHTAGLPDGEVSIVNYPFGSGTFRFLVTFELNGSPRTGSSSQFRTIGLPPKALGKHL